MDTTQYHLTKAGPRLINLLVGSSQINCIVSAPGMLIEHFKLVTNQDVFSGCDAKFSQHIADNIQAISFCGSKAPTPLSIRVENHRLGPELLIDVGPTSMYQALIQIRTLSEISFRQLFADALSNSPVAPFIAALYTVRANTHHEQHSSAAKSIREHAKNYGQGGEHGH